MDISEKNASCLNLHLFVFTQLRFFSEEYKKKLAATGLPQGSAFCSATMN
jgi:hypothetical protein